MTLSYLTMVDNEGRTLLRELLRIKRKHMGKEAHLDADDAVDYERGLLMRKQLDKAPVLREGIMRYLSAKSGLSNRTRTEYGTYLRKVLRIAGHLSGINLAKINADQWQDVLQQVYPTAAGRNKARRLLHGFYAFTAAQGWTTYNPIDTFPPENEKERVIRIMQPTQLKKLLQELLQPMYAGIAPAIGFMLWEGMRVNELKRKNWEDVQYRQLCPTLQQWLRLFPGHYHGSIIPGNWVVAWRKLRRTIGISDWRNETLFHTYIVYHLSYFRNPDILTEKHRQLNIAALKQRYGDISKIRYEDAAEYWNLNW